MKKLLVLALVLGIAGMANANLTWSADSITITVGNSAVVQLVSDSALAYPSGNAWVGNTVGTVADIDSIVALPAAGGNATVVDEGDGWWTVNALDTESPFTIAAGDQFDVTIGADAVGTYSINSDYYGSSGGNDVLSITVVAVPEPMTIALLGLGGLFLRRKK